MMEGIFLINVAVGHGDGDGDGSDTGGMIQLMELLKEGEVWGVVVVLILPFFYFFEG